MTRSGIIGIILASAVITAWFVLRAGEASTPPQPVTNDAPLAPARGDAVRGPSLFLAGNDRGMIRPCGCAKPKLGGIDRRLALLDGRSEEKKARSAVLAFGSLVDSGRRQQGMKLEIFLQALGEMGALAYCPGDGDLWVGSSFWQDTAPQLANFPLVGLNVMKDASPLFLPVKSFKVGAIPVVLTARLSPAATRSTEPGLSVDGPVDTAAIKAALEDAGSDAVLIVYGNGSHQELDDFTRDNDLKAKRMYLVISGVSDLPTFKRREGGGLVELGTKGRYLGELPLSDEDAFQVHVLDDTLPPHSIGEQLLDFYRQMVAAEDLLGKEPLSGRAPDGYAGSAACATCHASAFEVWKASRHGRAWATLEQTGDVRDPECVRCHVTGFGLEGGFDAGLPAPVDVQCEACHGPSQAHAETLAPTSGGKIGAPACMGCHDLENSPSFDFSTYWPLIQHGR